MKHIPTFQFNSSNWRNSRVIKSLDAEQKGWFIDLLALSWESPEQGTLPNDELLLRNLVGAKCDKRWLRVLSLFKEEDGVLFNQRLVDEVRSKLTIETEQLSSEDLPLRLPPKGSRINPEKIIIDQNIILFAQTKFPDLSREELMVKLQDVKEEFVDHWLSESRQSAIKLNWIAAFKNRIRSIARIENEKKQRYALLNETQESDVDAYNRRDREALRRSQEAEGLLLTDLEQ